MSDKKIHPQIGELEWASNESYCISKEITLFGEKHNIGFQFNADTKDDDISQRQVDNFLKVMDNPQAIYDRALSITLEHYNIIAHSYIKYSHELGIEEGELPESVNSVEELMPMVYLFPLTICFDSKYYDMVVCMGCRWEEYGGLAVKFNGDEFEIGTHDQIL